MDMWSKHPDMVAAWFLATLLLVAVGTAPWEKVRASHPTASSRSRSRVSS